jgi:DNA-binding MarR family transcriptional regulator
MPLSPVGTIYLLKRAELAVRSCMEVALAQYDLTPTQFHLLLHLRDRQEASAAALAREIGVRPQSIIEIIRPLERKRLLKREVSPRHRRVLHTRLTVAGRKLLTDALRVAARIEAELLASLDERRLGNLQEALASLWERAQSHALHPGSIRAKAEKLMRSQLAVRQRRGLRAAGRERAS